MHADLVFRGGSAFLADAGAPAAVDVAVAGGRIAAVGRDVRSLVGPTTEVVDLHGGLLIPGFQDAHVHPVEGGMQMGQCYLHDANDATETLAAVSRYVATHSREEWILGGGWAMPHFEKGAPTASALDAVTDGRPAFLTNRDVHGAWVNTKALEMAGITAKTADPPDGRIERDDHGVPTGTLHEGAMKLVTRLIPDPTVDELIAGLLRAQAHLHALGITGWQDAIVGAYAGMIDSGPAYLAVGTSGSLTARVRGALWWDRALGLEQIESLVHRRETYRAGRFAATSVKIMQDGVAENFTAAMLSPYQDGHGHATANAGLSFVEPDALNEAVTRLDGLGFQVHFHAIGDRAVRECLDAVEAARARNGPSANRHHIAHLQVVHPSDVPRFRALGVTANMQALWATHDEQMDQLTLPFLGEPRASWQYPFGDLARAGAHLAAGSDWPVSTPNPLAAIHTAMYRQGVGEEGNPFHPEQALTLAQALAAYTAGSAYVNGLDADTGTIAVGKLADLVVLDRDPFDGASHAIGETRVLQTFVEGERVFAADGAS